ncbi:hypothetical protein MiAbW_00708 [Microcystis aeruginosa NIES-4325]|uniref:Uncharacterized protein n=1 Tax=Microcystis aeruginosa NIES-4325 TaxID=2569534 RepID=A0A5J4F544_MICAE|nr:hypothetical protein MiAbW_00708 [Microcystis aeruginosa NIES-4325]
MVFLDAIYTIFVVSFSVDLEGFSWRLRVAPAPRVPRVMILKLLFFVL